MRNGVTLKRRLPLAACKPKSALLYTVVSAENKISIVSQNGLFHDRHQTINQSNAGVLVTGPWENIKSYIWFKIQLSWYKNKMKTASANWWPFFSTSNVLTRDFFFGMTIIHSVEWVYDDVTKWNHFPRYWPFVRRIHHFPPHKGQWRGALMFSLICA